MLMQKWTTKKPDKPGYWWALDSKNNASVVKVLYITYFEPALCIYEDEYIPLIGNNFKNWMWGSEKITEPLGEKI